MGDKGFLGSLLFTRRRKMLALSSMYMKVTRRTRHYKSVRCTCSKEGQGREWGCEKEDVPPEEEDTTSRKHIVRRQRYTNNHKYVSGLN